MRNKGHHFQAERASGTTALLVFSLVGSALLIGVAAKTGRYPYVACVGLVPLFVAIRVCRPLAALLWGTAWGLSLFAVSVAGLGPPIPPTVGSLLLLAGAPAVYAWLGALLTRWIGFSPYVLAVGWMGVGLALSPLGFNAGFAGASQTDAGILGWVGHALGYVLVAFAAAYVNAALVTVLAEVRLSVSLFAPATASADCGRSLISQILGCLSLFALQPSHPRAPPA